MAPKLRPPKRKPGHTPGPWPRHRRPTPALSCATPGTSCQWDRSVTGQCPRGPAALEPVSEAAPPAGALCSPTHPPAGTGRFHRWPLCTFWYGSRWPPAPRGECHAPSGVASRGLGRSHGLHRFTPQQHSVPRVPTAPRPATRGLRWRHRGLAGISPVTSEAGHLCLFCRATSAHVLAPFRVRSSVAPLPGRGRFIRSVPSEGSVASGAVQGAGAPTCPRSFTKPRA